GYASDHPRGSSGAFSGRTRRGHALLPQLVQLPRESGNSPPLACAPAQNGARYQALSDDLSGDGERSAAACRAHTPGPWFLPRDAEHAQPKYRRPRQPAFTSFLKSIGAANVLAIQECQNRNHVLESELAPGYRKGASPLGRGLACIALGLAPLDLRAEALSGIHRAERNSVHRAFRCPQRASSWRGATVTANG